jgi:hypothetical protein
MSLRNLTPVGDLISKVLFIKILKILPSLITDLRCKGRMTMEETGSRGRDQGRPH